MSKLKIVSKEKWQGCDIFESVDFYVDEKLVSSGHYGGQPEDNSRMRDYRWVEPCIKKIAQALGAEVEVQNLSLCEEFDCENEKMDKEDLCRDCLENE